MKKFLAIFFCGLFLQLFLFSQQFAEAAPKSSSKKSSISKEEMQSIVDNVNLYTRKVYASALFSPKDIENIIEIKLKLDNEMLIAPQSELAPLYFKLGNIYLSREYKMEAIDCFQTILENFPDTVFYPKAKKMLINLGIEIKEPEKTEQPTDRCELLRIALYKQYLNSIGYKGNFENAPYVKTKANIK